MSTPPRLALVGFMGSGKSTIGRLLAVRLDVPFVDLDEELEAGGLTIAEWFVRHGEASFREAERAALQRACARLRERGGVIALGGGAFEDARSRAELAACARTLWLDAPLEVLVERIRGDSSRPLASDAATLARLHAARLPTYSLADLRIDARGPAAHVVQQILEAIRPGRSDPDALRDR